MHILRTNISVIEYSHYLDIVEIFVTTHIFRVFWDPLEDDNFPREIRDNQSIWNRSYVISILTNAYSTWRKYENNLLARYEGFDCIDSHLECADPESSWTIETLTPPTAPKFLSNGTKATTDWIQSQCCQLFSEPGTEILFFRFNLQNNFFTRY